MLLRRISVPAIKGRALVLVATTLGVVVGIAEGAQGSDFGCFVPAEDSPFPAGEAPSAIAVADLNRPGISTRHGHPPLNVKRDLAITDAREGSVLVFLGRGDATYRVPVEYDAGSGPSALAASDLDGDGDKDLAVANSGGSTVSVLLGKGDGSFMHQRRYHVGGMGSLPSGVVARDLDRDGDRDLALTLGAEPAVAILLGRGDGTFRSPQLVAVRSEASALVAGRFDGDRKVDLAVVHGAANKVSILFGRGDGTFRDYQEVVRAGSAGGDAVDLVAGDFGRPDGDLDLAIAMGTGGEVSVRLGYGDGGFHSPVSYPTATTADGIAIGEMTAEEGFRRGIDLAVVSAEDDLVTILRGRRDETFSKRAEHPVGDGPSAIASADLRADNAFGIDDLAIPTAGDGEVSLLVNQPLKPGFCADV